jgi:hypothetical protein
MMHHRGNVPGDVVIGDGDEVQPFLQGPLDDPAGRKIQAGAWGKTGVDVEVCVILL